MSSETRETLASALEEVLWSLPADQLAPADQALRTLLAAAGCTPAELLAEMADESLVLAIQKRFLRNLAFEELMVNRYEKVLLRWFGRRLGGLDRAQEFTQELYLKLLTNNTLGTYNSACPFAPWLWRVAHNLWVGEMRRRHLEGLPDWQEPSSTHPGPLEEAAGRELEERIEEIMRDLPAAHQQVLREAMNGASADDTARRLGLTKAEVYRFLFRARRQVEQALSAEGPRPACRMDSPALARVTEGEALP
jgi:RNA polymerase sigma factor (sigma-70 family)